MKKFLAILLAVAMVMTLVPTMAFADEATSYMHVEALEDYPSRPENQLNMVVSIAAGDVVTFDFRPIGEATNDGGIFDVRTHNGARKLFYAKPSSSTPGTWSVNEQVGEAKNNGTVAMDTVSFTALEDGWYRVSFQITVDLADGLHIAFGYAALDVDNLTVGDKVCSFGEANVVEFADKNAASLKYDDGTEFTIERSVNGFDWAASLVVEGGAELEVNYLVGFMANGMAEGENDKYIQFVVKESVAADAEVSFVVYNDSESEFSFSEISVRDASANNKLIAVTANAEGLSGSIKTASLASDLVIEDLGDGFYKVTYKNLAEQTGIFFRFVVSDPDASIIIIDDLKIGDKTASFNDDQVVDNSQENTVTYTWDDGSELVIVEKYTKINWISAVFYWQAQDTETIWWLGYEMPAKSSSRNTIFVEYEFKTGDVVTFLVYIGDSAEVDKTDMYVRKSAKALYLGTDDEVYSGKHIVDYALPLLYEGEETGWYYIECVLQEDVSKLEFSVDGGNVTDGAIGATAVANITVNGVALDETTVVTDNNSNVVEPDLLDATGVELPTRDALQLIVTGAGATVVVKDIDGNVVNPGEEALTEKYEYTIEVEALEGFVVTGILVNGEEFESGKSIIADEGIEVMVATTRIFAPDVTAENATVVLKDAEGNVLEGDIDEGTEVVVEVEVAEGYELVSVTVNGEAYEAGTTVIVVEGLVVEVVTAEITEDVTPEETGAISIAVVAMVAIMGGAVVLKKKEF
ncbi:MAG: hypothetical protein IKV30_00475 [Clostridia bacterium]|nr:hypothetical protein [Clostridia bacterium]